MNIIRTQDFPPVRLASEELYKYLLRMGAPRLELTLGVEPDLTLGLGSRGISAAFPLVEDTALDDQYFIRVDGEAGEGLILGNNPRAVLLAAYRYLTLIGCRFLAPGLENESIPLLTDPAAFSAEECVTADLRHRGVCLEGADSIDDILRFIDWSPKVGYNSFFFQFEYPKTFLERYYQHLGSTLMAPQPFTMEDAVRLMPFFDEELKKRGMIQHRVGHGWTSKVLGYAETGWEIAEKPADEETTSLMAMVNGKRELWGGIPTNTNLCLSKSLARQRFTAQVVNYLRKNPSVDYLHIWLADDHNNSCECENCRKKRPSDWYVILLNQLDEALTRERISTRLVMLVYFDLLWEPAEEKILHPERFMLMFAPYTRSFRRSFSEIDPENLPQEPAFDLNHQKTPGDVETNLKFLTQWQKHAFASKGFDCFDYDYYMGRAHYGDPTYVRIAKTIAGDMRSQKRFGMNGYNSCQELRAQFPNALANYTLAWCSVDTSLDFTALATEFYRDCYGSEGEELFPLMDEMSELFSPDYVMLGSPRKDPVYHENMKKASRLLKDIEALVRRERSGLTTLQTKHWKKMEQWIVYTEIYIRIMLHTTAEEIEEAMVIFEKECMPLISALELEDPSTLDVYRLHQIVGRTIQQAR